MLSRSVVLFSLCCASILLLTRDTFGQCQTHVLASPAIQELQPQFTVSVATLNLHCLTDGEVELTTEPPGAVMFENGLFTFFDIFAEVSSDYWSRTVALTPLIPPGIVVTMRAVVTFADPWYPQQIVQEPCWVDPLDGQWKYYRPAPPPPGLVPGQMTPGQSDCFLVYHNIYWILLTVPPGADTPIIAVTPGCVPADICMDLPCTPGGPNSFRADVVQISGNWYLEFEYSNPAQEPACYCVTYTNNLFIGYSTTPLGALDEAHQTFDLSINAPPLSACGTYELFSYPPGAEFYGPIIGEWSALPEPLHISIPVSAGAFQPGQEFRLVAYVDYGGPCPNEESEWAIEHVRVTPERTLERVDVGGECITGGMDHVPTEMDFGDSDCFVVCHDVYYVQLNTPPNATPGVTVVPGCNPPCIPPLPCIPGEMQNCVYWTERIGSHWYLRFEYSNPTQEPRCYCISYNVMTHPPIEPYLLTALDESTQSLSINVWTSDPTTPVGGTIEVKKQSHLGNSTSHIQSFFDVSYHVEIPVEPDGLLPGTAYQYVTTVDFDPPELPTTEYHEWVMVEPDGRLSIPDDIPPCLPQVPPLMSVGESQCFLVCHDIYEVIMHAPPGSGRPIINVVPECEPPCVSPFPCQPGSPVDYIYWFTQEGLQWMLHFEYSNPFIEPVCYCVTYVGNEPNIITHQLVALDRERQTMDVSVAIEYPGPPIAADGEVRLRSEPPGAYFGHNVQSFFDVGQSWQTMRFMMARGALTPGQVFDVIAEFTYLDPPLPGLSLIEQLVVSPTGGLETFDGGSECSAGGLPSIPETLTLGVPECLIVCHDIYHIPINLPGPGYPMVNITPGCAPLSTSCLNPFCNPGGPWDFRYELLRVGGTWILEFEYSNPIIEPVCYCVEVTSAIAVPVEPYLLTALDPNRQMYDVTLWLSNPGYVASGDLMVHANPNFTVIIPFANVSTDYFHVSIPASAGGLLPGQNFEMFAETHFDPQPDLFDTRSVEYAVATITGIAPWWDPPRPCVGDNVPPSLLPGQSHCFVVCHRVYDVTIAGPPGGTPPTIAVEPGCNPPRCPMPIECRPGGPSDYCYDLYNDGLNWHLRFEYSNPFVEPVCYCVTVAAPPCSSVTDLTIAARYSYDPIERRIKSQLAWYAPQRGFYHIYATLLTTNPPPPPGPAWTERAVLWTEQPDSLVWVDDAPTEPFTNYVIICDCGPFGEASPPK